MARRTSTKPDPEAGASLEDLAGLVAVEKDGELLHVHPTTLKAHQDLGWTLSD